MGKTRRKTHTVYLDRDKHEQFAQLSKQTRITQNPKGAALARARAAGT